MEEWFQKQSYIGTLSCRAYPKPMNPYMRKRKRKVDRQGKSIRKTCGRSFSTIMSGGKLESTAFPQI